MQNTDAQVLKHFKIQGLHGYKNVTIDFPGPARIVIAENGSGKTTILSALNSVLTGQFENLESIDFGAIECVFSSDPEPVRITRDMLPKRPTRPKSRKIGELLSYATIGSTELQREILKLSDWSVPTLQGHPDRIFHDIYARSPYSWEEVAERVSEVADVLNRRRGGGLKEISERIDAAMHGVETLYLPTYRRVELPLSSDDQDARNAASHVTFSSARYLTTTEGWVSPTARSVRWDQYGIQFGLADVEQKLNQLLSVIQKESNAGYRAISAEIVDELLAGRFGIGLPDTGKLPEIEALQRLFSRVEEAMTSGPRRVGMANESRLSSIRELYASGAIQQSQNKELRYFLSKLSQVVDKTREQEANIEQFVARVNEYLQMSSDEKGLVYDPARLRIVVQNTWTGRRVKLDDLSSGEKQIISLLAHLYLFERGKFVLVDEPELSLSIDWQKKILPDVLGAPTCSQLLAITHSPFIFDNDLDPFAGPLVIERQRVAS